MSSHEPIAAIRAATRVSPGPAAILVITTALLICAVTPAGAQKAEPTRKATAAAGVGTSLGWYGVQLEPYFLDGRASVILGAGYTPELTEGHPTGATFAVGARGYTGGLKHRAFAELCYGQVVTTVTTLDIDRTTSDRHYGPALLGGYQYTAASGFTALSAAGLGYAPDTDDGAGPFFFAFDLALGYTWR